MKRIVINTQVPAGTDIADARAAARLQAVEQFPIQIVEESVLPVDILAAGGVNDSTVDRVLTTVWDSIN